MKLLAVQAYETNKKGIAYYCQPQILIGRDQSLPEHSTEGIVTDRAFTCKESSGDTHTRDMYVRVWVSKDSEDMLEQLLQKCVGLPQHQCIEVLKTSLPRKQGLLTRLKRALGLL